LRLHPFETLNISFLLPDPAALPAAHRRRRRVARGQPLPATATGAAPDGPRPAASFPFSLPHSCFPSPKTESQRDARPWRPGGR
jgi:hypothetical protein